MTPDTKMDGAMVKYANKLYMRGVPHRHGGRLLMGVKVAYFHQNRGWGGPLGTGLPR